VAADLQIAGQPAVVDFGSKQVGSPMPVAAVARLGQATARAVAEAVGCLGPAAGVGLAVAVGGAAVGAEAVGLGRAAAGAAAEAEAVVGLDQAAEGAAAVGLDLVAAGAAAVALVGAVGLGPAAAAAQAEAEAAELAAAAGFDHDVTPGSCQARLPLRAIRLQREVAAAAAGPGEGTTSGGASPWLGARAGGGA